jgi:hypothetical protein
LDRLQQVLLFQENPSASTMLEVTVPLAGQEGSLEVGHKPIDLVRPDPVQQTPTVGIQFA